MNTNEVLNKLIAEMERRKDKYGQHWINAWRELEELISFTKSLQQEQPEVDLEAEIEMEWDSFNKHLAEYDGESEDVVWLNSNSFNDVARHFYELGKKSK